ncbi:unnamed protein product [Adineta ricciae]|uniref:Uncharacterized protein n=1 Tax=Adineta ricciae TaxID=249248 RepID=A0A816GS90_ADIRI|nr:unnamed protein product [Adineta ricciae]
MTWWTLTSVTSSFDVLQSPMYLGREKVQTIFEIETKYGKSIREYSHLQNDDEILLLPGINLKVIGSSKHSDGIHIIHLREINSFVDLLLTEYHNPKLEEIIQSTEEHGTLSLDSMNLNDQDMKIIVKLGVRDKRCIVISLCNNAITSVGASILSQMFKYYNYFMKLILDGNQILDKGVEAIAKNASGHMIAVRILKLNSVGMTDVGCQYLAQMVRVNHSIYHIYLNDNQIGNRGLRVLLVTIESCENCLKTLTFEGNKRITDASVDFICTMTSSFHYFHHLNVRDCSISAEGKKRLQHAAQQRNYFTIGV